MNTSANRIKTKDGKEFEIPLDGSLGLLALGYKGLMLWRQQRNKAREEKTSKTKKTNSINEQ